MTRTVRAPGPPGARLTLSFALAASLHLAILFARLPVSSTLPPASPAESFVLVDAVTVETPPEPAAPAVAVEPPPAVLPEPAPEPVVETPPEVEPAPAPAADVEVAAPGPPEAVNEAAVMAPPRSLPEPPGARVAPLQSQLDPGGSGIEPAGAARPAAAAGPPGAAAQTGAGENAADVYLPFYKVDTKPEFRSRAVLRYPEAARRLGLTGTVVVEADIDETGAVRAVRVERSAGHGFDEAALEMVRSSTFSPARAGGKNVAVRARFTVTFKQR